MAKEASGVYRDKARNLNRPNQGRSIYGPKALYNQSHTICNRPGRFPLQFPSLNSIKNFVLDWVPHAYIDKRRWRSYRPTSNKLVGMLLVFLEASDNSPSLLEALSSYSSRFHRHFDGSYHCLYRFLLLLLWLAIIIFFGIVFPFCSQSFSPDAITSP